MEDELVITEGLSETGHELAAENATQHVDGKKEPIVRSEPTRVIKRQPACGHHAMNMRMKAEPSVPSVQHVRTKSATSRGGRFIYWSCADRSLSCSESNGLAVALRRCSERCR